MLSVLTVTVALNGMLGSHCLQIFEGIQNRAYRRLGLTAPHTRQMLKNLDEVFGKRNSSYE